MAIFKELKIIEKDDEKNNNAARQIGMFTRLLWLIAVAL